MIHLDFETRSKADLKNTGASFYSKDSSTSILCFAYCIDSGPIKIHRTYYKKKIPKKLRLAIESGHIVAAHNARFEYLIWNNILHERCGWPRIPIQQFLCTMGLCSRNGLPKKLEEAAKALHLPVQKDMEGHKVMLKMAKPRKPTKTNPDEWFFSEDLYSRLCEYCIKDVETEKALCESLQDSNPSDIATWENSMIQNDRGIFVDKKTIERAIEIIKHEQDRTNRKLFKLTKGAIHSTNQTVAITKHLKGIKSLAAIRLDRYLADPKIPKYTKKILRLRQKMTKTSTSKLHRIYDRIESDGRIRDLTIYHGAHTGRDTGVGPQPLNMPRGDLDYRQIKRAVKLIRKKDISEIKKIGPPLHVISSCARSLFMAGKGNRFLCADYSGIEARINFWLADEKEAIKAFRQGKDIYKLTASKIYNKQINHITDSERFIGKQATLGLGYGMGWKKFIDNMGDKFNLEIDIPFAKKVVSSYREMYTGVTGNDGNWGGLQQAAQYAVANPGVATEYKMIHYICKDNVLCCGLPSGRFLSYREPKISYDGYGRPKLSYKSWTQRGNQRGWFTVDTYGGKLTENVVQSIARDLLVDSIKALEEKKYNVILSVYDEILCEVEKSFGSLDEMIAIMTKLPRVASNGMSWGEGIPLQAAGWEGKRYRK